AQGAGVLAALVVAAAVIRRTNPVGAPPPTGAPPHATNPDHYFGATLVALLAFGLLMNADVILVKMFFAQAADFGPYARAATVARTLVFLSQPIVLALFPQVTADAAAAPAHRAMLFQALALAGLMIAALVALCLIWPTGPLWLLFGDRAPTALQQQLVRLLALAMAPTGLVQVLLMFALAQRRFRALWPLAVTAPALILGIAWFHQSLFQVAGILALCTLGALLGLAGELARPAHQTAPGVRHD
ncbi:MAG: hypothetical protein K9N49_10280, partial [Candidatus Marinimicrobia bacterium]|nr:hypothetical protein [Candidatus Neomarinimicrobiota bacterium]